MRFNKRVFVDLFIKMISLGVLIGLAFPFFVHSFGVRKETAFSLLFFLSCIIAGILVGLTGFLISRVIIKKKLLNLVKNMRVVDKTILEYRSNNFSNRISSDSCIVEKDSDDCFGQMADAFNELVKTLIKTLRFQKKHRLYIEGLSENIELSQLAAYANDRLIDYSGASSGAVLIEKDGELIVSSSRGIIEPDKAR